LSAPNPDIVSIVRDQFYSVPPEKLGIALSGGGDSVALMHILAQCFDPGKVQLFAATVDHGLRDGSADEARTAGVLAKSLGIAHEILIWRDWDGKGNLQDQARRARFALLAQWAEKNGIREVAFGHTADDQAETVLMRLARSAGVTGLAAMPVRRTLYGMGVFRPLLGITRKQLRDYLTRHDISWAEDPSNKDTQYDRIKARRALEVLEPLGLTATSLATVASNLAQASGALDWYSFLAARDGVTFKGGDVVLDLPAFRILPEEIGRRLLQRAVIWISGAEFPPRRAALSETLGAIKQSKSATLGGCRLLIKDRRIWICREHNAVRRLHEACGKIWDGRWRLIGGDPAGCEVRPLGQRGLMLCPDWRETGHPGAALTASPSVWRGDDLVAAPLAGLAQGWTAELIASQEEFFSSFLSH